MPNVRRDIFDELIWRVENLPPSFDTEDWRREFLIAPLLTDPQGLAFAPSEIGAEISYPLSNVEIEYLLSRYNWQRQRVRPDYIIVPAGREAVAAIVEAKRHEITVASHLRHGTQVAVEQFITHAPIGILTDGERWTVFRDDTPILHFDDLAQLRAGFPEMLRLVGRRALSHVTVPLVPLSVAEPSTDQPIMPALPQSVRRVFPNMRSDIRVVAPSSAEYNSIAAAAGDLTSWWWPDSSGMSFWPDSVPRRESVAAFVEAYRSVRFELSEHPAFEPGWERIAIFSDAEGMPRHAARQLGTEKWLSKLGSSEAITHVLDDLAGSIFGEPTIFMRRRPTARPNSR